MIDPCVKRQRACYSSWAHSSPLAALDHDRQAPKKIKTSTITWRLPYRPLRNHLKIFEIRCELLKHITAPNRAAAYHHFHTTTTKSIASSRVAHKPASQPLASSSLWSSPVRVHRPQRFINDLIDGDLHSYFNYVESANCSRWFIRLWFSTQTKIFIFIFIVLGKPSARCRRCCHLITSTLMTSNVVEAEGRVPLGSCYHQRRLTSRRINIKRKRV